MRTPRHRRNRHLRLETEKTAPKEGRRLRLLHRHRRKRPLIACRNRPKRRRPRNHRKHSGYYRRACRISKPWLLGSPARRVRRRRRQPSPTAVLQRSLLPRSNINNLNSWTCYQPTARPFNRAFAGNRVQVTGDGLGATRDAPAFRRSAPIVRFIALATFFTGDLLRECSFNSRMSCFVQGRALVRPSRFVAINKLRAKPISISYARV